MFKHAPIEPSQNWGVIEPRPRIIFREITADVPEGFWSDSSVWQVDSWTGEWPYPQGIAWVAVRPPNPRYMKKYKKWLGGQIEYILVNDGFRRQGIATQLVKAVLERWPNLYLTPGGAEFGEPFIDAIVKSGVWEPWDFYELR